MPPFLLPKIKRFFSRNYIFKCIGKFSFDSIRHLDYSSLHSRRIIFPSPARSSSTVCFFTRILFVLPHPHPLYAYLTYVCWYPFLLYQIRRVNEQMAEQQLYKTTLPATDPVHSIIYKESLTSKVDELLKNFNIEKMNTNKKNSINRVVTDTALRRNTTKPYNLDQRCKSPSNYKQKGLLKGTKGTLEENLIPDLDLIARYHEEQYKLFNELSKNFPETPFLKNTKQEKDDKGRWFLYRNSKKFTTNQFLNFVALT